MNFFLAGANEPNPTFMFIIIIASFVLLYFISIRPQRKRQKEHQQTINSLEVGAEVLLNGGIIGTITKIKKDSELILVKIADNVEITTNRGFVIQRLPNGTVESIKNDN